MQLYAGRDELKDMKALSASMGRSGAKETRSIMMAPLPSGVVLEAFGVRSDIADELSLGRAEDRPAAHYSAVDERVRSQADLQPSLSTQVQRSGESIEGPVV
ncbi:hypothetical protein P6U16_22560 (plasmid) [Rhizobium sp. 32-5/1]|uniref:hypothetical protein n=1 Tax=Rhizobium sp. 32-5/1 TaxID=3019602 RepID=UPI00240CF37D|nr:hypothetical protein [Rhizobium sp. 32-5/1]WEZ85804.1 hypothetical protein P6U16_22560 [Rhizobium sp. 32-5/1]